MERYLALAQAFSYPDERLPALFAECEGGIDDLRREYDRLFRETGLWLYGTEYDSRHEFQRSQALADIMGFYRAFGVEPSAERPDALPTELEFMHYLILKAIGADGLPEAREKADVCRDAQRKFFKEHLQSPAEAIARRLLEETQHPFYRQRAAELLDLIRSERQCLAENVA